MALRVTELSEPKTFSDHRTKDRTLLRNKSRRLQMTFCKKKCHNNLEGDKIYRKIINLFDKCVIKNYLSVM